jgi:hypothetical protein
MTITGSKSKRHDRGVGFTLSELTETSRYGQRARQHVLRWFPSRTWVQRLAVDGEFREDVRADRRRLFLALGGVGAGLWLPTTTGCAAIAPIASLLFEAIQAVAQNFPIGTSSEGNAFFGNGSPSREGSQLLTTLFKGISGDSDAPIQDEKDFVVEVPARTDDFVYFFSGLVSEEGGDHYMSGQAAGTTHDSDTFEYE